MKAILVDLNGHRYNEVECDPYIGVVIIKEKTGSTYLRSGYVETFSTRTFSFNGETDKGFGRPGVPIFKEVLNIEVTM